MALPPASKTQLEITELQNELIHHLGDLHSDAHPWEIRYSTVTGGRGVFAKRDIATHEIIFRDRNLILGPRFYRDQPLCVVCYKNITSVDSEICVNGCSLPMCDACQNSPAHSAECKLISDWKPRQRNKVSSNILHALSSIRGVFLSERQRNLLRLLQVNALVHQEEEVDNAIKDLENFGEDNEVRDYLYFITGVLNTNAFETVFIADKFNPPSLRGLFPLAGVLNHLCVPSIRYSFDQNHIITFHAIRDIKKDDEICTSYSRTLIGSPLRRMHLKKTKDFFCYCERCKDASEFGTNLAAINCVNEACDGVSLPADPLNMFSHWTCQTCDKHYTAKKMYTLQNMISVFISSKMHRENFREILRFLKTVLPTNLPPTNQLVLELKLFLISIIGGRHDGENGEANVFTLDDFLDKEQFCMDVLEVFRKLKMAESVKAGKLYFELYNCRNTIISLRMAESEDVADVKKHQAANEELLEHSWKILYDNNTAPKKLLELAKARNMSCPS